MTDEVLTVTVDDKERDLFMSYGLLTVLSKLLPGPEAVGSIPHDPKLRDAILTTALAERTKTGKVITPVENIEELGITIADAEATLEWVMEHLTGFFVRGLAKTKRVLDSQKEVQDLFLENGSEA